MTLIAHCRLRLKANDPTDDDPSVSFTMASNDAVDFSGFDGVPVHMEHFFNAVGTDGTNPISHYIAGSMSRVAQACTFEAYDITSHLDGSPAGSPRVVETWTLGADTGGLSLPSGVGAVVSFRADYGTDVEFGSGVRPRSRDRNRVYVGPINNSATQNAGGSARCELTPQFITDCLAALFDLSQSVTDVGGSTWVLQVWSRKGAFVKLPVAGFMDDRPDYQRRRSDPDPGSRVTRAMSGV